MDKTIEQQARELLAEEVSSGIRCGHKYYVDEEAALRAIARALTRPVPSDEEVEASALIRLIASEYLSVQPFDMPTGQGDADIGWQVMAPEGKVLAEVFSDDLLAALRMARAALGVGS